MSHEERAKRSKTLTGRKLSAEHRANISRAATERFKDPRARARMALAKLGSQL